MNRRLYKVFFVATLSVCLIVPFNLDIFISGLPAISNHFSGANASLVITMALVGLAVAQPFYGPLLDRFGRRPVLLAGLWFYTLASILVMVANSFPLLLISRFCQALGASSAIIAAFAIARDSYDSEKLVNATSLIMGIVGVSPAVAPLLGSFLNTWWGWRGGFIFLFILGAVFTFLIQLFFKETLLEKNDKALMLQHIAGNYFKLLKHPGFLMCCLAGGFSYGILFSYFNLSSLFIIEQMHFSLISYGLFIAVNAVALIIMAFLAPQLAKKIKLLNIVIVGFVIIIGSGIIMWLVNSYFSENIYTFMFPIFITMIGIGLIRPAVSASAMQLATKEISGSASALFNFIACICAAIATTVSAKLIVHLTGFGIFIVLLGVCALFLVIRRHGQREVQPAVMGS